MTVAYFSMEFMLSEGLPIHSGGLGQVAGDQMKAASDLGVPVAGIGLLYGQGYFRQDFDSEGRQQVLYPVNDPVRSTYKAVAAVERRMATTADQAPRLYALASLLGSISRPVEAVPA